MDFMAMTLDKHILELIERSQKNGVDTRRLPPGTKFFVRTRNSLYIIENLDYGGRVMVQGGKYFHDATPANFSGSTFGGTMIKIGWIGYMMRMEFHWQEGHITKKVNTSGVRDVLIKAANYEYRMGWEEE